MSTLEQEIIEKFQRLESDAQKYVLQAVSSGPLGFDYDAWW
jgi:hypothetical protein